MTEQRYPGTTIATGSRLNVLLVEDDGNDVELLRRAFSSAPANNLDVVFNGREAVDRILEHTEDACWPNLIVCDLNMPVMNGFQFIKWLKRESPCPSLPLVVLTSSAVETDLSAAYELGAAAYLVKPSSHVELQGLTKALVEFWRLVHSPPLRVRK